ncbi:unnamed protein product [Adineta ricciae]|uniref:Transcriptional repressor p66 coiled-coil MBD2-interaction domain-containing protein n=1 Tax=Adineta ricciae TaxID=249248 RepID=A0A816DTV9_ADIRI|nr:unnamed protein product [Adineta ricciae]CAF1640988.1 unnamed protein product [Adineta ricciae]
MSLKRPLSPESNNKNNSITTDIRQLKRCKLHSIIQELQNEEAKLVLLKKLRTSQQQSSPSPPPPLRTNKDLSTTTNGFHSPIPKTKPTTSPSLTSSTAPITNPSSQSQPITNNSTSVRKSSNSPLLTNSNRVSSTHVLEDRKAQAKLTLRKHLERDLLNIPLPKPSLQDISFIPNGISLEFQPIIGLEDVVQCLSELQNDRHRLPQRFTDHAQVDSPYVCDQCGTDFTIRWWKHPNSKSSNQTMNILCDRCKKQVTRRMAKSEHSSLLKNVFILAMEQEKEIDKHFNALIKQQKQASRSSTSSSSATPTVTSSKSSTSNSRQIQSVKTTSTHIPSTHQSTKTKHSIPQTIPAKLSQPSASARKSHQMMIPSPAHGNHSRTLHDTKLSMSMYHHHHQPHRSSTTLPQQIKSNQMAKMTKNHVKQSSVTSSTRMIFPPNSDLLHPFLLPNVVGKSTSSKKRTFPHVEMK